MQANNAARNYCRPECRNPDYNECADCWKDGGNPALYPSPASDAAKRHAFATMSSSERMDWPTPSDYFAELHEEFDFTVDACARADNAKLPRYWSERDEGLMQSWAGERVYMNPPYGRQLPRWILKAWNEIGHAELIVALIPARVDTSYWHDYIFGHAEVRFLRGRLRFEGAKNVAPFPVAVVVWRRSEAVAA